MERFHVPEPPSVEDLARLVEEHFGPVDLAARGLCPRWRLAEQLRDHLVSVHERTLSELDAWLDVLCTRLKAIADQNSESVDDALDEVR